MWELDREAHKPMSDVADWHAWLITQDYNGGQHTMMLLQFASYGIDKPQADKIVSKVLAGLNSPD